MSSTFTKHDKDKTPFQFIAEFWDCLLFVHMCLSYGAKKYGKDNWKLGVSEEDLSRNKSAAVRHIAESIQGRPHDSESGLPHISHAITDLLFVLWIERNLGRYAKDEPKPTSKR